VSTLQLWLCSPVLAQARPETIWIGLILMLVVFYGFMFSNSRKEKKRRREMLENVKKTDRVMTIGGVIGTVVNVKENEIVLKVDESANTKISFVRGAIQKVLAEDEKPSMDQR
jgi:preprotein translocase subunit YajC